LTRRLLILDVVVDGVVRTALVFAFFLLFSGHNAPGGGFIAGLVAGICLILLYVARGEAEMRSLIRVRPEQMLGVGLLLALFAGSAGWIWGGGFLESGILGFEIPVLGVVKAPSALVFDIGVFAVVVGLTAALVSSVGDEVEGGHW